MRFHLNTNAFQFVAFADPFIPDTEGVFSMNCFTLLPADATPTNDLRTLEINVVDASQTNIELSYDEGNSSGGLSWNGGNGGIANYFIPPFYPCNLTQVKEWIVSDANNVGFSMMIFDDDGINGAPLTVLDSINEVGGSFITGGFVTTNLTTPIRIDSGGFYVLWYMGGTNIQVGRNQVPPFSFRTYEILGTPTGANFSPYRDIETEDFMIRAVIQHIGVGINELKEGELFSQFYPNPANDKVSINFDPGSTSGSLVTYQLFDLSGKLIQGETVSSVKRKIEINVKGFNSGIYICKFKVGNTEVNRKLTIVK